MSNKRLTRRDFARTSVTAGAAAMALPGALLGKQATATPSPSPALAKLALPSPPEGERGKVRGHAVAAARRRRVTMPPEIGYGGMSAAGRDLVLSPEAIANQAAPAVGGWREGMTMPAEYYVEEKHYLNDERFVAEHFWLMADHENRIPKPGDYFLFQLGRGESLIILRDQAGQVKAYHNVCRHRGSRLCIHEELLPSEARKDGKPEDARLSVVQLGSSGNTPVFRCPYHAWTYDLTGKLVSFPPGMPSGFDASEHGLHPAHVRTVEGFIYVSFARQEPPEFDSFVANFRAACQMYGTKDLKIVARKSYPTKGNWKLAVENFRECYHCQPSHTKTYSAVHQLMLPSPLMSEDQRARIEQQLAQHGHPAQSPDRRYLTWNEPPALGDKLVEPTQYYGQSMAGGMAGGNVGHHLVLGHVTGSLDGKAVAPLLPTRTAWTHRSLAATSGFSTAYIQCYDDHVAVARFTPRDVDLTDVEIFWMVNPNAKEKEYDVPRMMALWDQTYREDRWIVENNHHGIKNGRYNFTAPQPYAWAEGGPSGFVKWYMTEVVPRASGKQTEAV